MTKHLYRLLLTSGVGITMVLKISPSASYHLQDILLLWLQDMLYVICRLPSSRHYLTVATGHVVCHLPATIFKTLSYCGYRTCCMSSASYHLQDTILLWLQDMLYVICQLPSSRHFLTLLTRQVASHLSATTFNTSSYSGYRTYNISSVCYHLQDII